MFHHHVCTNLHFLLVDKALLLQLKLSKTADNVSMLELLLELDFLSEGSPIPLEESFQDDFFVLRHSDENDAEASLCQITKIPDILDPVSLVRY